MLSPDVELRDLDGRHFAGWLELLLPPAVAAEVQGAGADGRAPWAAVFIDGDRVLKAVVSERGAVAADEVPFQGTGRRELAALRRALEVSLLVVLERDALPRMAAAIEGKLRAEDDLVGQGVTAWREVKRLLGAGVWVEPRFLEVLPVVPHQALQRTFDLLVPDETSMLAYVFSDDRRSILASVLAVKRGGDVVLTTTHLGLEEDVPERELAPSWRSQYTRVLDAAERLYAPPSIAVFLEQSTYRRILTGPGDQLSKEIAARNLLIDPMPSWLAGLLGTAGAFAAAARSARSLSRFVPPAARRAAAGIAGAANERFRDSGAHPFSLLGFDPIEVWNNLRGYLK